MCLGPGLVLWYELSNGKVHEIVRSPYRAGSLTAATRELARYKLDSVGMQWVTWDKGSMVRVADCSFTMERKRKSSIGNRIFVHRSICVLLKRLRVKMSEQHGERTDTGN